jgi:hypothetical protein
MAVLACGLRVTAIGIGVGSLLAVVAGRLLASQMPDINARH